MTEEESREPLAGGRRIAEVLLRAGSGRARSGSSRRDGGDRSADRPSRPSRASATARSRDRRLGLLRAPRQLLDRVAVAIARRKIHPRVGAGRILLEDPLDDADALDEDRPVARRHQPHRRDDVADGELVRGFALMLAPEDRLGRVALRLERPMQRLPGGRRGRRLIAQPLQQLDDEGGGQPLVLRESSAQQLVDHPAGHRASIGASAMRSPQRRASSRLRLAAEHVFGPPAQLVDQRDPQHDRDRPELADVEHRAALIGADVADQRLQVEAAGRVQDQVARQ